MNISVLTYKWAVQSHRVKRFDVKCATTGGSYVNYGTNAAQIFDACFVLICLLQRVSIASGNINHLYIIRRRLLLGRLQTCVRSLKSTNFLCSRCHIFFVSFRNNVGINCTLRQYTFLDSCRCIPIRMTLNDLECPIFIHLKVRLVDSTLDVRLLRVSDSTICIGVARGGGGGVG